jgi:hypothetical protein
MRYSPSQKTFYPESINYSLLPNDLITIADENYAAIKNRMSDDDIIVTNGVLSIQSKPVVTDAERAEAALQWAKENQTTLINIGLQASLAAGIDSSALGTSHIYPSNQTDQQNLQANVLSSLLPGLPITWTTDQLCADAEGVWLYRPHSASQIQQVGIDVKAKVLGLLTYAFEQRQAIHAATDVAGVEAILWKPPS